MSAMAMNYITRWKKSIYKCPACERTLWMLPITEGIVYFCSYGPCPSLAANNGASTIEELRKNVENEKEQLY